jgi:hypothetical protein
MTHQRPLRCVEVAEPLLCGIEHPTVFADCLATDRLVLRQAVGGERAFAYSAWYQTPRRQCIRFVPRGARAE